MTLETLGHMEVLIHQKMVYWIILNDILENKRARMYFIKHLPSF